MIAAAHRVFECWGESGEVFRCDGPRAADAAEEYVVRYANRDPTRELEFVPLVHVRSPDGVVSAFRCPMRIEIEPAADELRIPSPKPKPEPPAPPSAPQRLRGRVAFLRSLTR